MKEITSFEHFEALDIRVGKIVSVVEAESKKLTYRLTLDFGPEIGTKISCAALRNYAVEELVGKQIVAVLNFGVKKRGPEKSEVLVLGVKNEAGEIVYLTPEAKAPLGTEVF